MIGRQGGNYRIFHLLHLFGVKVYAIYVPPGGYVGMHVDNIKWHVCRSLMIGILPGSRHFFKATTTVTSEVQKVNTTDGYFVRYDPGYQVHGSTPQTYPQLYLGIGVHSEERMEREVKIRFNHLWKEGDDESLKWRVIIDGEERLASAIHISSSCETTEDEIHRDGEIVKKWHITTHGAIIWRGSVLHIV